jgi:[ribosomal protein S5]-alanine N-acetyltransferase
MKDYLVKKIEINTKRFLLRSLQVEDVSEKYVGWISDQPQERFILYDKANLKHLKNYVKGINSKQNVLFLGIYTRHSGEHIGNIKYEPIDIKNSYSIMGILVGEQDWRSRSVALEVIRASANFLKENLGISYIYLGVNKNNFAAVKAFKKVGFMEKTTKYIPIVENNAMSMELKI